MSGQVLFDSDVLIDFLHGVSDAADRIRAETVIAVPAISVVTQLELIAGIRDKSELRKLVRFLKRFTVVKIDEPICDRTVSLLERYRLSHGLLMADAFIAATALRIGSPLVTKNKKDYQFIRGIVLPQYP